MDRIFQEYFLDNPAFRLVAILICINKIFQNQLQRNPFLRQEFLIYLQNPWETPTKKFAF